MKILLTILLSVVAFTCHATDYWVNNSGSDGSTGTQVAPWQTVGKVNASTVSGDKVHFAANQSFYGAFVPKSGVSYDAYGGGKATITGFSTVGGWASVGGLQEALIPSHPNIVLVNDQFQPIGRYPKVTAANKGYITFTSHGGSSVSGSLSGVPSFVGGEVVVRNCHWILNRYGVGSQSSSTVTYSSGSNYGPKTDDGNGFFFQNHVNACTQPGEWMWSGGKLRMSGQPGTVKAATVANLVTIAGKVDISFTNLIFSGASNHVVTATNSQRISFTDCEINYAGNDGMNTNSATNRITLLRTNFNWSNNNHIRANNSTDWNIQDCVFKNNGMTAGMGQSGDGSYYALSDIANNSLIQYNSFINSGYVGISFNGGPGVGNVRVLNNLVDGFCLVKDDGAGIYTGYVGGIVSHPTNYIEGNIVRNGLGANEGAGGGTQWYQVHGIYLDDYSNNTIINNNSVSNCGGSAIYLHLSANVSITNNTTFANKNTELLISATENTTGAPRNITMNGNIFFNMTKDNSQLYWVALLRALDNNIQQWGTWNNNYYCRPLNAEKQTFFVKHGGTDDVGDLAMWQSLSGKDGASKSTPVSVTDPNKVRMEYNETKAARVVSLPGTFIDVRGASYNGSITLAPYTSAILIQTATGPTTYQSAARSGSFTRNNCAAGSVGSTVVYSVAAGRYTSTVSQSDADSKAQSDVSTNGQPYANINGVCTTIPPTTFSSASKSGTFIRNDCAVGHVGSSVTYTVASGKYTSTVSQQDADGRATADINTNGQSFANANGSCTGTPPPPTTFTNAATSRAFTRVCSTGYKGSSVTYTVPVGKYTATTQAAADAQATADINANGQNNANQVGTCTAVAPPPPTNCSWWDKFWHRRGCRFKY